MNGQTTNSQQHVCTRTVILAILAFRTVFMQTNRRHRVTCRQAVS